MQINWEFLTGDYKFKHVVYIFIYPVNWHVGSSHRQAFQQTHTHIQLAVQFGCCVYSIARASTLLYWHSKVLIDTDVRH